MQAQHKLPLGIKNSGIILCSVTPVLHQYDSTKTGIKLMLNSESDHDLLP